jgi:hypothetical protein
VSGKNLRQIERLVAGHAPGDRPDDDPDPDLEMRKVTIEVSPATYALYRPARKHLDERTGERLSEDAACAMAFRAAMVDADGDTSSRPPAQVAFTICQTCARGTQDGAGIVVDVDAATVQRVLCDAEFLGEATAESPSRMTASVTPRIRRQVLARDHHRCAVPGCRNSRFVTIHHLWWQCLGGGHKTSNLTCLCQAHHDMLHHGRLVIQGEVPNLRFFRVVEGEAPIELTGSSHVGLDAAQDTSVRPMATPTWTSMPGAMRRNVPRGTSIPWTPRRRIDGRHDRLRTRATSCRYS